MTKTPKSTEAPKAPELVDAVTRKEFTSTVLGNLSAGQKIKITADRYKVWKKQGLVN